MWFKAPSWLKERRIWVDLKEPEVALPPHEMFTVKEVAGLFRVQREMIYKMLRSGVVGCYRMKLNPEIIRIPREEVLKIADWFRARFVDPGFFRDLEKKHK